VLGEHSERDAIRMEREKLTTVVSQLQVDGLVTKILRLADERSASAESRLCMVRAPHQRSQPKVTRR